MSFPSDSSRQGDEAGAFQAGRVLALSVCHFIHDVYSSFLAPLLPLIIEKLSLTLTQAGFLSTIMQIPALLNPYLGSLADRINFRYFVILAPALTAVPMSLIGLAPSYGVLLLLLFTTGISVSVFHVPTPTLIARFAGPYKGKGMSWFMTGGELARTIGPLVAVGAVTLLGLDGFYPIMTFGLLTSVWLFVSLRQVPMSGTRSARTSVRGVWQETKHVMIPLIAILWARGFMHACMTAFLPTFIEQQTGNLWTGGLSLALFEAAGVAGVMAAGPLSDRIGRRRVLFVSLVCAPISLLFVTLVGGWWRYVFLLITGFSLLSTTPVMLALVQEHAGQNPSAANGWYMMVSFLARSAVVVLVGLMGDLIGLQAAYFISAGLGFLGIPFVWMLPARKASR